MHALRFGRNVVATCLALLAIIVPAAKATGQTPPTERAKNVLLVHGAWADGSSWSKLIRLLEAKGLHVVSVQIPLTSFADDLRSLLSPVAFVRAGGFFENFLYGLQAAQGGTLPVFYNPTNRKSTMVASDDIGREVATLLTGPAWSGHRVIELGSMVSADEVAGQLGEALALDVKAFAVPRAGWAETFEQFGVPKGHTGPAEEMFESVNAGWMDLGITGTEHVAGTTSARDVFGAAQNAVKA